ncbi:MAG: ankyrin repeat domain-containing protein [Candidatus Nanopelagicales bacterium]|mgnify:FL=1|jgi:ankyrin repeat protein
MDDRLIRAAARGDLDAVRRAHARGASVEARDDQGRTALVAAAYGNHLGVARFLIDAGADVNAKDETVQSAYLIATAEVGDDPRLLDLAIASGARINDKDSFNGTALIRAADRGYPRVVKRLLREDIDIDHVNRLGWTALHEAIILGDGSARYVEVVDLLVAAGADVSLRSRDDGLSPVEHAQARGYDEMVEILRSAQG